MSRLSLKIGIAVIALAGVGLGYWLFGLADGTLLRERIAGETPQAKMTAYVRAAMRGDEDAALELWELPHSADYDQYEALSERREKVTGGLAADGARTNLQFTILHIEWWRTCCELAPVCDSRNAGGARVLVQFLDDEGLPSLYTFDVFVRDLPYFGDGAGNPFRHWVIRDVYPAGHAPLFWRLVSETTVEYLEWEPTPTP